MFSLLIILGLYQLVAFLFQLFASFSSVKSYLTLFVVWVQSQPLSEIFFGSSTFSTVKFYDSFQIPEIWAVLIQTNPYSFCQSQCLSCISSFGQALDLELLQLFACRDFINQIVDTGKGLCEIRSLDCSLISFIVRE